MAEQLWTDEAIDGLLNELDSYAMRVDHYTCGLPIFNNHEAKVRAIVRKWLASNVGLEPVADELIKYRRWLYECNGEVAAMKARIAELEAQRPNIATDIHYRWSAGEVCFDCPCGNKENIISQSGDKKNCYRCGRVYRVVHYVEILKPDEKPQAG